MLIPGVLDDPLYAKNGILSLAYIPRHLYAIFLRSWNFVDDPPFFQPSWWGLSLFLTTPLFLWLVRARLRDPRVAGLIGIALALIPIVTHGNVGISQFDTPASTSSRSCSSSSPTVRAGMSRWAAAAQVDRCLHVRDLAIIGLSRTDELLMEGFALDRDRAFASSSSSPSWRPVRFLDLGRTPES